MRIPLYDLPVIPRHPISKNENSYIDQYSFFSTDSEDVFNKSLKKLGANWKYASEKFTYQLNRFGMRSPEITTIKNNDFFIAYGCSHTEGIGISVNDRYSNILSKRLNLNFLNAGQGGSSHNYLWTNNILGSKNIKFVPKFVVCQWPEISRLSILNDYSVESLVTSSLTCANLSQGIVAYWKQMIVTPEVYRPQTIGYFHSINQMWNNRGVPVIHFTLDQETHEILGIKKFHIDKSDPYKLARDLAHPGYDLNLEFAEYIEREYKNGK